MGLFPCITQVRDNVASPESTAKSLLENGIGRSQLSRFEEFIPTDEFCEIFNQRCVSNAVEAGS